MKYKDWLNDWLNLYVMLGSKPRTYQNYRDIIRLYIAPYLGEYDMAELSPTILQSYIVELMHNGGTYRKELASGTVSLVVSVIQTSLHVAARMGVASAWQCGHIQRPKVQEKRVECFSLAEQRQLEAAVLWNPTSSNFGIVLTLYTGLRVGELMALRWKDIDLENAMLSVNGTCRDCYENGKFVKVIDSPKTYSSRRIIPLPKRIVEYLRTLKRHSESDYVVSQGANHISIRSYQNMFTAMQHKLNIPHRGFHSLRHTFATRALECGMDVRTLAEILGHKNPNVTLVRYAHSMLEHKICMMNKVGILLERQ